MTDRPIIFSAPMVRALLAGRKTQTRRILKTQPPADMRYTGVHFASYEPPSWCFNSDRSTLLVRERFVEGDRLWVREAWSHDGPDIETVRFRHEDALGGGISYGSYYRSTETAPDTLSWRPSIHMPRWASRLTLGVVEVRVQRLRDITEQDAEAEGVCHFAEEGHGAESFKGLHGADRAALVCSIYGSHRKAFRHLWESLNGAGSWDANPWVAAISFTLHRANIDALDIGAAA